MQLKRHSVSPGREAYDRRTGVTRKKRGKTGFGSLQGSLNGASENSLTLNLNTDQVITPEGILSLTGSCCSTFKY